MVHHDIWNYDTPMAPNLLDVSVDGRPRKILAQATKQGLDVRLRPRHRGADLADRGDSGAASDVPGEQTAPTQPIPSRPAPYAQQGLKEEDLIDYTPAIKDSALKPAKRCRMSVISSRRC